MFSNGIRLDQIRLVGSMTETTWLHQRDDVDLVVRSDASFAVL